MTSEVKPIKKSIYDRNNLELSVNFVAIEFDDPAENGFVYEYKVKFDSETSDRVRYQTLFDFRVISR